MASTTVEPLRQAALPSAWWGGYAMTRLAVAVGAVGAYWALPLTGVAPTVLAVAVVAACSAGVAVVGSLLYTRASWSVVGRHAVPERRLAAVLGVLDAGLLAAGAVVATTVDRWATSTVYPGAPIARALAVLGAALFVIHVLRWRRTRSLAHLIAGAAVVAAVVVAWIAADAATPPSWRVEQALDVLAHDVGDAGTQA